MAAFLAASETVRRRGDASVCPHENIITSTATPATLVQLNTPHIFPLGVLSSVRREILRSYCTSETGAFLDGVYASRRTLLYVKPRKRYAT